jgi:glucose-1-phosphate adenylyltransferase
MAQIPSRSIDVSKIPVLILAGGCGNRLLPLTEFRPKPVLAFGSCRLIDFTLSNCRRSGFTRAALLTQYGHHQIDAHIRQAWGGGFRCLPPAEGQSYRGTGDAVYQNSSFFKDAEHVLILAGDHVYEMDYRALIARHLAADADLTLSTVESPLSTASSFGVVEVDEEFKIRRFVEKPAAPKPMPHKADRTLVSMGIYVIKVSSLLKAHLGIDFGYQIVPSLLESGRVVAYNFSNDAAHGAPYWRDVGDIDSYYAANMDFLRGNAPFSPRPTVFSATESRWIRSVSRSIVSSGVQIDAGAEIEDCILMPNVRVGRGARLRRLIVDEGVRVPDGFSAGYTAGTGNLREVVSRSGVVVLTHMPARERTTTAPRPAAFRATTA